MNPEEQKPGNHPETQPSAKAEQSLEEWMAEGIKRGNEAHPEGYSFTIIGTNPPAKKTSA